MAISNEALLADIRKDKVKFEHDWAREKTNLVVDRALAATCSAEERGEWDDLIRRREAMIARLSVAIRKCDDQERRLLAIIAEETSVLDAARHASKALDAAAVVYDITLRHISKVARAPTGFADGWRDLYATFDAQVTEEHKRITAEVLAEFRRT